MNLLKDIQVEIETLIRARYPIIYIISYEESRVIDLISKITTEQEKHLQTWAVTTGMNVYDKNSESGSSDFNDPIEALQTIQDSNEDGIFVLKDFHAYLEDPTIIRKLRDLVIHVTCSYKTILILSPILNLPKELEKDVTIIDFPLPDTSEILVLLKSMVKSIKADHGDIVKLTNKSGMALVKAAQGLTLQEAELVFSKCVVNDNKLDATDIEVVLNEKKQIVRKSGFLEFYPVHSNLADIGGYDILKDWLLVRGKSYSDEAKNFGLEKPKGVLLLGSPGCGKSLIAKAIGHLWQFPLLRLDFGKIFSGIVGSSEQNMRHALKIAEGISPSVLWIDEIEKGLSGGGSSSISDGGTATRVFGTFLTWMQEKKSTVFIVATANRIDLLPPELLRKGRFDEIFFMDLPDSKARKQIFEIHLIKRKRDPNNFDLTRVVKNTKGFSGAEIESCIVDSLFYAFAKGRDLQITDIESTVEETIPLSKTYQEQIEKTRQWAKQRARPASRNTKSKSSSFIEVKK